MRSDKEIEEFIKQQDGLFIKSKLSFRARKSRKVLLYKDKNLITLPKFLANWLSDFQIVTEYQQIEIDHIHYED